MLIPRRLWASVEQRRARLLGRPVLPERRAVSPEPLDEDRRYALEFDEPPD